MKTIKLNKTIFSIISLLILTSCSSQRLIYEPLGEMDKPLPTIVITTTKMEETKEAKNFVIDKSEFQKLIKYIKDQLTNKSNMSQGNYEYGCYKIVFYMGTKKSEYIIDSRIDSWSFFNGQMLLIKSNEELLKELEVLLKRLK